ncbi:arginine/ornithine transport system permease protein [Biostraticola tofi]|uniref:Arginine/ornithine transport system permease protein n=2 Tax=Biostraticola tofi TaxID=466109 RepID=A0A4R3YXW6_9GAMM|nr:arginine/ornithine transport system permease protein [Biostraticola tofi]
MRSMSSNYALMVLKAGWVTLELALSALLLSVVIGLICALGKQSGRRCLRFIIWFYTLLARGIPDLVMMLLVFYSLPALINYGIGEYGGSNSIEFSPFMAGFITLGFIFGAYMTETFRNALINIPHGEIEAASAFGFSPYKLFIRIILPKMIRLALPGFTNNWLVLIKATALVSLLGLEDIMFRAKGAAEATGQPFSFYLLAAGFYLAITLLSVLILRWLGKRYELGIKQVTL